MNKNKEIAGKILYGATFSVLLPVLLILWARLTKDFVHLPVPGSLTLGLVIAVVGMMTMSTGMANLFLLGGGLPMNAFPPPRFVAGGIYRILPHPIYVGFSVLCIGVSIFFQSSSGLWLVSPVVAMACAALVYGYENESITKRYGPFTGKRFIRFPANELRPPLPAERWSVYVLLFLPWLISYEAVVLIGEVPDALFAYFPFENSWPVQEWSEFFYGGIYLFVILAPLAANSSRDLYAFAVAGIWSTVLITLLFLVVPVVSPPRAFVPQSFLGNILLWERNYDSAAAAFPSFHVVWAWLASYLYSRAFPRFRILWWSIAVLISVSCVLTGMHALADVIAGILVVPLVLNTRYVWDQLRTGTERIANSWKEWHFGPVRIINHGAYSGAGAAIGLILVGTVLGPQSVVPMLVVASSSIIGAALWAQFIEGSPSLLRPYGFYGGLIGGILGCVIAVLAGGNFWGLMGAFSLAAPLIQAGGRVRCLVQGCCHGHEAPAEIGIRYQHPRSRVCRLSDLKGVPLHPTPLYSILWNFFATAILARLWSLDVSLPLIVGVYLILNGLGRFVEESYRGEPQTPSLAGLRLYQWAAIASIVLGAVVTTIHTASLIPAAQFSLNAFVAAFGFGLVTWFMQGVDFPNSNVRFSRLV